MSKLDIQFKILPPFEKWLTDSKRHKIAYGGRGGGKTEGIIPLLVIKSYQFKDTTILCIRQVQNTLSESSKATIEKVIKEAGLSHHFEIKKDYILNIITNTIFLFKGLRNCTAENIQSIANVKICFIEEAQVIDDYSWLVLDPSIRSKDSEIWVAFNPRHESDCFYKLVKQHDLIDKTYTYEGKEYPYKEYEDNNRIVLNINYDGNLFHTADSVLEVSRQMLLETTPENYNHVWLGQLKKAQGRYFAITQLQFYDYNQYMIENDKFYIKYAIVDPAFGQENCYTSCIIYTMINHKKYIIDSGLMRNTEDTTTDEILAEFLISYDVKEVMIESNFSQKELAKRLKKRGLNVTPFYVHKNKLDRIINAQYLIREQIMFDSLCKVHPELKSTQVLTDTREGRNYIAMRQLLDFSDIAKENNIKNDDYSYLDFPDCLASLVLYGKKEHINKTIDKIVFNDINSKVKPIKKRNGVFGIDG